MSKFIEVTNLVYGRPHKIFINTDKIEFLEKYKKPGVETAIHCTFHKAHEFFEVMESYERVKDLIRLDYAVTDILGTE